MTRFRHIRKHGTMKATVAAISSFAAGSILVLWSWNVLAVDLFGLPEARFKHAVAFALLMAATLLYRAAVKRTFHRSDEGGSS